MIDIPEFIVESVDISEFIVESVDTPEEFIDNLNNKKIRNLNGGIAKRFTGLASNATLFRWNFGDGNSIETAVNPYIHTFSNSGTYSVSHQSCYTCPSTETLLCSSGWCTKSIGVGIVPINITLNIPQPYNCIYPCSISATVTWQNLDDTTEYTFRPAIIIDEINTISYTADITIPPATIPISTIDITIDIPSQLLPGGNHKICPVPI